MPSLISIELDDEVRRILEAEAHFRDIGLEALLREIVTEAAKQIRRKRIREQSEAVARYVVNSPEAAEFLEFWGTPRAEIRGKPPALCSRRNE
jgi:hypothetical protein